MTTFRKWLDSQPRGTAVSLERAGVVSHTTIHKLRRGGLLRDYAQAKRLSEATHGVVTIADLCDAAPARRKRA